MPQHGSQQDTALAKKNPEVESLWNELSAKLIEINLLEHLRLDPNIKV